MKESESDETMDIDEDEGNKESRRHKGYKIVDLNQEDEFIAAIQSHAVQCHHAMKRTVTRIPGLRGK